jgi:hypothetical protein
MSELADSEKPLQSREQVTKPNQSIVVDFFDSTVSFCSVIIMKGLSHRPSRHLGRRSG